MLGWRNQLPMRLGGGDTPTERYYRSLRKAVGEGGAGPEGGLEDAWTMIEARAIAASHTSVAAAAYQMWPQTMTQSLDEWEQKLFLPRAPTDIERREVLRQKLIRELDATIPAIRTELQGIDPNFDVDSTFTWSMSRTTTEGRMFGPLPGVSDLAYGLGQAVTRIATAWPAFSDGFILRVRYTLPAGATLIPLPARRAAEDYLADVLPSWVDFELYNLALGGTGLGFYLDGGPNGDSLLDQTAFGVS